MFLDAKRRLLLHSELWYEPMIFLLVFSSCLFVSFFFLIWEELMSGESDMCMSQFPNSLPAFLGFLVPAPLSQAHSLEELSSLAT